MTSLTAALPPCLPNLQQVRSHPLYELHGLWGGKRLQKQRQCICDVGAFLDLLGYYRSVSVMMFELEHVEVRDVGGTV